MIALIEAGIINGVINSHAHDNNPQHDAGDIQRMTDQFQRAQCGDKREGNGREHGKRDEPIQVIYKYDKRSADTDNDAQFE